jgi:hypothetical protein
MWEREAVARNTVDREAMVREPWARIVEIGKQKQDKRCLEKWG